ncbi:hypothetical protein [Agaribacterium sp. ZY112]|uniref:hypothetical protein n=1 Tax=Agaribacterium sp. ZY112 TaxID=3233574 RepID=UPI0035260621
MDALLLQALPNLSHTEWIAHVAVFALNIILLIFAPFILRLLENGGDLRARVHLLRYLNILVLGLHGFDIFMLKINPAYQNYFINVGLSLMVVYAALFIYSLFCFFSKKRFGKEKEIDGKAVYLDTYSSRLIDLVILCITLITTVYVLIKIWHADSMLETTGIFGIFVAFLAFTSSIWAPDIISGLIILNTKMLEDGDVVLVDAYPDEYIISRVSLIYVVLFDVRNNHRTLIRNSRFTNSKLDNISRVAGSDGIRQKLSYKIGYPSFDAASSKERVVQHRSFMNRVDRMFKRAEEGASKDADIKINRSRDFSWSMTNAGDYALEFTLWFYLERLPNTRLTGTIRRHLIASTYKVNEAVYEASIFEGLNLATPDLLSVERVAPVERHSFEEKFEGGLEESA